MNDLSLIIKSVFKKHKPYKRFSGYHFTWRTLFEEYYITVYEPENRTKDEHTCRVDTKSDDHVYSVKSENLVRFLESLKKQLEWKREMHKKQSECTSEKEFNEIELVLFLNSRF